MLLLKLRRSRTRITAVVSKMTRASPTYMNGVALQVLVRVPDVPASPVPVAAAPDAEAPLLNFHKKFTADR